MKPDFASLPAVPGHPDLRIVDGSLMDQERYEVEGWEVIREIADGYRYWAPSIEGIHRYAELRRKRRDERKVAYQTRMAEDDDYTEYVNALLDAKPQR